MIKEGMPLSPVLLVPSGDQLRAGIADRLKANLAQVGVALQIQTVEPATMFDPAGPITHRNFDLALLTSLTQPDPGGINAWVGADVYRHPTDLSVVHRWQLEARWLTSEQMVERLAPSNIPGEANDFQGQNYSGWCNEQADIAVVQANLTFDLNARKGFYATHQALFTVDLPVIPLFFEPQLAASAPFVCGIKPGPYDPVTWNAGTWFFEPNGACGK